jgi:hypothetical protein
MHFIHPHPKTNLCVESEVVARISLPCMVERVCNILHLVLFSFKLTKLQDCCSHSVAQNMSEQCGIYFFVSWFLLRSGNSIKKINIESWSLAIHISIHMLSLCRSFCKH